jgi:histidine triad (HIT) family protein
VYEDARALAFLDINPVRRGHLLVIPKAHRAQVWEMDDAEFAGVYRCLPKLVLALKLAVAADAVNILSLNGAAGGQTVFHLHVHLIPVHDGQPVLRRKGRRVAFQFVQRPAPREELERVAEEIRAHLPGRRRAPPATRGAQEP